MNSHIQGGKTIFEPREDEGVDFICDIPPFIGNESVANLIAAAPQLLSFVEEIRVWLMAPNLDHDTLENMQAQADEIFTKATTT